MTKKERQVIQKWFNNHYDIIAKNKQRFYDELCNDAIKYTGKADERAHYNIRNIARSEKATDEDYIFSAAAYMNYEQTRGEEDMLASIGRMLIELGFWD